MKASGSSGIAEALTGAHFFFGARPSDRGPRRGSRSRYLERASLTVAKVYWALRVRTSAGDRLAVRALLPMTVPRPGSHWEFLPTVECSAWFYGSKTSRQFWKCGIRVRRVAQRRRNSCSAKATPGGRSHGRQRLERRNARWTCRPARTHGDGDRVLRVVR
jgi:hypothetical protein